VPKSELHKNSSATQPAGSVKIVANRLLFDNWTTIFVYCIIFLVKKDAHDHHKNKISSIEIGKKTS
jgi:hypothetical protein